MKGREKEQSSERKRNRMIDMERQRELRKKKAQTDRQTCRHTENGKDKKGRF